MAAIRLYLDEDVWAGLAVHLRRRGYDALTTVDAGRASRRLDDESQLAFAAASGRVILTINHCDFVPLDQRWRDAGREHAGILLVPLVPPSDLCRRVEAHLAAHTAEEHYNLVLWC